MNENEPYEAQADSAPRETDAAEWHAKATRIDQLLVRMNYGIRSAANVILGLTDVIRESELSPNLGQNVSILRANVEGLLKESAEIIDLPANSMPTKTLTLIPSYRPQHHKRSFTIWMW